MDSLLLRGSLAVILGILCLSGVDAAAQTGKCDDLVADIVFALDASGSVGEDNFDKMLDFVKKVAQSFTIAHDKVRIGLFTFATETNVEFYLDRYTNKGNVINNLKRVSYSRGTTYTDKALHLLPDEMFNGHGNRQGVSDVVIMLSDGKSTQPNQTLAAIERIKQENYTIFTIGIGDGIDQHELDDISSDPDSTYSLEVQSFDNLVEILQNFTEQVCSVVFYIPTQVEYVPPPPPNITGQRSEESCGDFIADMVLVLDASGSIGETNFKKMLSFVERIMLSLNIAIDKVRVGLLTFSVNATIEFHLDTYSNQTDTIDHLNAIRYFRKGTTHTEKALNLLPDEMFNGNGNRPDVPDIVVLFSDGKSTEPNETLDAIARMKEENYTIFTIGIGDGIDKAELNAIASHPADTYSVEVDSFDDLAAILDSFSTQVCEETNVPSCGEAIADIVIVLDSSGSIKIDNFNKAKDFLAKLVRQFKISRDGVRVGLLRFATDISVEFYLDTYSNKGGVLAAIKDAYYSKGKTYTDKALRAVREQMFNGHGNRPNVSDIVIVLLDGKSTRPEKTKEEIKKLKEESYTVFTIGIGADINVDELNDISSDPDSFHTSLVSDFDSLESIREIFTEKTCEATFQKIADPQCSHKADLIIILDASSSVGLSDYIKMKNFVKDFVMGFEISQDKVRVGLVVFNSHAYIESFLDAHDSVDSFVDTLEHIHDISKGTYTNRALQKVREEMLGEDKGNRDNVPDILLIFTDGKSYHPSQTEEEAKKLKKGNVQIFSVGIGGSTDNDELKAMASRPEETYVRNVKNYDGLRDIFQGLTNLTCEAITSPMEPSIPPCRSYADLVIIIDFSTSVGSSNLNKAKELVKDIVLGIHIGSDEVRVALVSFDLIAKVEFSLQDALSVQDILDHIDGMSGPRYGSWTYRAFRLVRTEVLQQTAGDRPNAHDVIIFISDGLSRNPKQTKLEADKLKENGVKIITIGTDGHNRNAIRALSSAPSGDFSFAVSDFDGFDKLNGLLKDKSCGNMDCGVEADIVIVMDSSTSISEDDFKEMREFVKHLIFVFEIGPDHVRVGVATFNYDAVMEFQLNTFVTKYQVLKAVDAISGRGSGTHTDKALKLVREVMFTEENGNRESVPDLIILLTDGRSVNRERATQEAIATRGEGVVMVVVGIGSQVSNTELRAIASAPYDDHVFQVKDFDGFSAIERSLQRKTCGVPPVMNPNGMNIQADIVFAFDCSDEVMMANFQWALTLASNIVKSVRVGKRWARFGAIKFNTDAILEMTLDSYFTRPDILAAIRGIQKSGWGSRVEKALRQLRTLAFKDCLGGRDEASDVAIIFTAGSFTHMDVARYEALLARNAGIRIFVIGLGSHVDKFELEILTSSPYSKSVFIGQTEQDVHQIQAQLMHELNAVFNVCH